MPSINTKNLIDYFFTMGQWMSSVYNIDVVPPAEILSYELYDKNGGSSIERPKPIHVLTCALATSTLNVTKLSFGVLTITLPTCRC